VEQDERTRQLFEALGLDATKVEEMMRLAAGGHLQIEPDRPVSLRLDSMTDGMADPDEDTVAELA
jgi:hypothetical protein